MCPFFCKWLLFVSQKPEIPIFVVEREFRWRTFDIYWRRMDGSELYGGNTIVGWLWGWYEVNFFSFDTGCWSFSFYLLPWWKQLRPSYRPAYYLSESTNILKNARNRYPRIDATNKNFLSNRVPHTRTPDRSMNEWMKLYLDDCKTTAARNVSPAIGPFVYLSQRQHITWVSYLPQYILVQTHTLGDASRSQNQPAVQKQSNQNGQRCENVNVILWLDSLIKMCEKPGLTLTLGVPIHAKKTSQSDFEFTVFMQLILFV